MKKVIFALLFALGPIKPAAADLANLTAEPRVVHTWGPVSVYNPLGSPRAVYYYDLRAKEHMLGGEIPLLKLYALEGTFGLATNIVHSNGANPLIGGNLRLPNPLPAWLNLDKIRPSLAAGYNIQTERVVVGLSAAIPLGL